MSKFKDIDDFDCDITVEYHLCRKLVHEISDIQQKPKSLRLSDDGDIGIEL